MNTVKYLDFSKFVDVKYVDSKYYITVYNLENDNDNKNDLILFLEKDCQRIVVDGYDIEKILENILDFISKEVLKELYDGKSIFTKTGKYCYSYDKKYRIDIEYSLYKFKGVDFE